MMSDENDDENENDDFCKSKAGAENIHKNILENYYWIYIFSPKYDMGNNIFIL